MIDQKLQKLLLEEEKRQKETIDLIPSENYSSLDVLSALGTCLTNKYAEGYPGKRYYQGNRVIDEIENLAIERAKRLFGVPYVNVQPYSGSPANMAVYFALVSPGEVVMGMDLSSGGHLTHGSLVNFSGTFYKSISYGVDKKGWIGYEEMERSVKKYKPKIIWAGATAYPRIFDWERFSKIAQEGNSFLVADISHYAGLIAGSAYPSPSSYADVITSTTHKTLRGPRGAIIMVTQKGLKKDPKLGEKIGKWVFPGIQGGPHLNTIAAIAVCLDEASKPSFKKYASQVVKNAKVLSDHLIEFGFNLVSGGTDNHLILADLRKQKISGKEAAIVLEEAGVIVNANTIPHDPSPPYRPSGIRLGTPAVTTRGMKEKEMEKIAAWIKEVIENPQQKSKLGKISQEVKKLCIRFPI